jgi:rfaE bifunctional protein nucleotidyltransferase chain/domain
MPATPKIMTSAALLNARAAARASGRKVVQCHGCFDIVHPGHIRHLRQAKSFGDVLLVSITGDAAINKGTGRPLIPEELRAENLAALDFVDWVFVEPRATALELLGEVQPDVYVKGREYEHNDDPRFRAEREMVERSGGRVVFSSGDVVFSSTALIAAMERSVDPFHHRLSQLINDPRLTGEKVHRLIGQMRGQRMVVVGEPILDTYVFCDRPDVAGESPVLTLRPLQRRQYDAGAAIIARHAAALGAKPTLVTVLPEGDESDAFCRRLGAEGVEVRAVRVPTPIPEKQRYLVGQQKVMKVDLLQPYTLDAAQQDELLGLARDAAAESGGADAGVITDFGLGLFSPVLVARMSDALRPKVRVMSGDVSGRRSNLRAFRRMDLLCPSESELRDAMQLHNEGLPAVVWRMLEETWTARAIVTLGSDGLIAFEPFARDEVKEEWTTRLRAEHVPALCPLAIDPLGCGDSLLTAATLALAGGADLLAAGFVGACAAAIQVQRLGNMPISATDLRHQAVRVHSAHLTFAAGEMETRQTSPRRYEIPSEMLGHPSEFKAAS